MQHNMRDPNRDHTHGRIYRVTAKDKKALTPVKMQGKPTAQVLQNFFSRENGTRYRTRIELSGRDTEEVVREVLAFTKTLDPKKAAADRDEAQALLECLWVHEEHRMPNMALVEKTFQAEEARVRAAAVRTLGHWAQHKFGSQVLKGHLPGWERLLNAAAADPSPLVRAEAVKAALEFDGLVPAEVIFSVATRPMDPELEDVLGYARGQINVDKIVAEAIKTRQPLSPAAEAYALSSAAPELLMQMKQSAAVYEALLARAGIPEKLRRDALAALAKTNSRTQLQELVANLTKAESQRLGSLNDLANFLPTLAGASAEDQQQLQKLVNESKSPEIRKAAYTAWLSSGKVDAIWQDAVGSREKLSALLSCVSSVRSEATMEALFPRIRKLMFELPESLRSAEDSVDVKLGPPVAFEYYQPNPGNVAVETLDKLTPKLVGSIDQFQVYVPGGARDEFATRQSASLLVSQSGSYKFHLTSDDGSRLYIDGKQVIDNDGLHGMVLRAARLRLTLACIRLW